MGIRINYSESKKNNTNQCFDEINVILNNEISTNIILLVPEQFSSFYEQLLVEKSIEKGSFRAEILTFKRLAYRVFAKHLQMGGKYIDNAGKSMLMYEAVSDLSDKFEAFSKAGRYPAFATEALKTLKEFKRYRVTPEKLTETASKADSAFLRQKLTELSEVYIKYEEMLDKGGYCDADDNLSDLALLLNKDNNLNNTYVWFDGFDGFTPAEMDVVKTIMNKAIQTNFTFCCEKLNLPDITDVFYPVVKTVVKVEKAAELLGIRVHEQKNYKKNTAFSDIPGELEHLVSNYFKYPGLRYNKSTDYIKSIRSESIYEEVMLCALEISQKVKSGKMRYGDISVVSGLYDEYREYIETVFDKFDIPVFMDEKRSIAKHPVTAFLLSLLDIYINKYSYQSVFTYLKSSYTNITDDEVSLLENYILKWGIKGVAGWNVTDWDFYTDTKNNKEMLLKLNEIRKKITSTVQPLYNALKGGVIADTFITVIFDFLVEQGIFKRIENDAEKAEADGDLDISDEIKQSWNILMDIFNQIHIIAADGKHTVEKYRIMLELAFAQKKIGVIPPRTDDVFAGAIDKAYGNKTKMLMILGANDRGFPGKTLSEGLLTDKDRAEIMGTGLELAPDTKTQVINNQINTYNLLNLPEKYLYISYSAYGPDGSERRKSSFFDRLDDLFENYCEKTIFSIEPDDFAINPRTGLDAVCSRGDRSGAVTRYFRENGLPSVTGVPEDSIPDVGFDKIINELLGDAVESSPTVIEKYTSCPYKYFAEIVLSAKPRIEFSISPPDAGSIMHGILKNLVEKHINDENDDYDKYIETAAETFSEMKFSRIFNRDKRYGHLGGRLIKKTVDSFIILKKQVACGDFKPIELEVAFGRNKPITAPRYSSDGHSIYLNGRIDRVDGAVIDDSEYYRIIDYKSSDRGLKLYKINEGLDIQLASYMMAYQNHSGTNPAGMYYFTTEKKLVETNYGYDSSEIAQSAADMGKMEGYTLKDPEVIKAMDSEINGSSKIIPVRYNAKKQEFTNKVLSEKDLESMMTRVGEIVTEKTQNIFDCEFPVSPANSDKPACLYCSYNKICGFDIRRTDCSYRYIEPVDDKKIVWGKNE